MGATRRSSDRRPRDRRTAPARAILATALLLGALAAGPAPADAATFAEYSIPTANSFPGQITAGPDGALWFIEGTNFQQHTGGNRIGRITTAGAVSEYGPVTTSVTTPDLLDIAAGPDGRLYFTEGDTTDNEIGSIDPATASPGSQSGIQLYKLNTTCPADNTTCHLTVGITLGPDNRLWFAASPNPGSTSHIGAAAPGALSPGTDQGITLFPFSSTASRPNFMTAGPDGALWFTESTTNQIGRITTGGAIAEYPLPTGGAAPGNIVAGPDGALWFTEPGLQRIGRLDPAQAVPGTSHGIEEFAQPAERVTRGPDGNLWFTDPKNDAIGRLDPTNAATGTVAICEAPIPTAASGPLGITTGPDGNLWFTQSGSNQIGSLVPASVSCAAPGSTPPASTSPAPSPPPPGAFGYGFGFPYAAPSSACSVVPGTVQLPSGNPGLGIVTQGAARVSLQEAQTASTFTVRSARGQAGLAAHKRRRARRHRLGLIKPFTVDFASRGYHIIPLAPTRKALRLARLRNRRLKKRKKGAHAAATSRDPVQLGCAGLQYPGAPSSNAGVIPATPGGPPGPGPVPTPISTADPSFGPLPGPPPTLSATGGVPGGHPAGERPTVILTAVPPLPPPPGKSTPTPGQGVSGQFSGSNANGSISFTVSAGRTVGGIRLSAMPTLFGNTILGGVCTAITSAGNSSQPWAAGGSIAGPIPLSAGGSFAASEPASGGSPSISVSGTVTATGGFAGGDLGLTGPANGGFTNCVASVGFTLTRR